MSKHILRSAGPGRRGVPGKGRGDFRAGKRGSAHGAGFPPRAGTGVCATARPNPSLRPRAALLSSPRGSVFGPPFSFRRRSRHGPSGPRRKCGVRRREPLCGATGVYQIKGAPAALCAVGNKRERAAWRSKRKAPGGMRVSATPEEEDGPLDPQQSLRKNPPSKKEGDYGGTWFPRQIARGPQCGAALHFRRNAAIVGVSGRISSSCRMTGFPAPTIFLCTARRHRLGRRSRHGASAPRRRVSAFDEGSPCVGRPESIESWGPHCATRSGE